MKTVSRAIQKIGEESLETSWRHRTSVARHQIQEWDIVLRARSDERPGEPVEQKVSRQLQSVSSTPWVRCTSIADGPCVSDGYPRHRTTLPESLLGRW